MVVLASILCYFRVIFGETFHGEQVAMPDDCAAVAFGINEITSLCHACLVQKAAATHYSSEKFAILPNSSGDFRLNYFWDQYESLISH